MEARMSRYICILISIVAFSCDAQMTESILSLFMLEKPQRDREITVAPKFFSTSGGTVALKFPAKWFENKDDHPYDLQCHSESMTMTTGVFVYPMDGFSSDYTPKELLVSQIEDLKSKRKNFKQMGKQSQAKSGKKIITRVLYFGEKGVSSYYYMFSLIQFDAPSAPVVLLLQISVPGQWEENQITLAQIAKSAKVLEVSK